MAERLYYRAGRDSDEWVEDIKDATADFEAVAQTTARRFPGSRVRPVANRRGNQKWVVSRDEGRPSSKVRTIA